MILILLVKIDSISDRNSASRADGSVSNLTTFFDEEESFEEEGTFGNKVNIIVSEDEKVSLSNEKEKSDVNGSTLLSRNRLQDRVSCNSFPIETLKQVHQSILKVSSDDISE